MRRLLALGLISIVACSGKLDLRAFRHEAEQTYAEVSPGWTIFRREPTSTIFVRGDQLDRLDIEALFADYQKSGLSGSDFFARWTDEKKAQADARRRTLEQSEQSVVPILKSGAWMRVQDLGAIGPKHLQNKIRPWRQQVAPDLFVVLGVPEEKLGFRFASLEEVSQSKGKEQEWLDRAVANLDRQIGTSTGTEMKNGERLTVIDLDNKDGISGLVLSPAFRARMFQKFGLEELGAAVPLRNVLVLFDPTDPVYKKPVRARAHQLYDSQNHPAFRGLLKLDKSGVSILEPAKPEPAAKVE
ncbi:MAG: hypothetical protein IPG45_03665 [Deltaproteobacteria bacterium]|nr:hypothetical protein [Deltaproteobacteria bacterium]